MREVIVRSIEGLPPGEQPAEVVERKGAGHPDTICDAIAEAISVRLCVHYLERFGAILHHNVDKVLLVGGASRAVLGGGEVTEPIELYLAGRATSEFRGERIPVADLAVETARDWLRRNLRFVDLDDVRIFPRIRGGSGELTALFGRGTGVPLANDTSCGVGFAPLSDLERVVLSVERMLNAGDTKARHPALGEDVKVMGVRHGQRIELTIGCAIVARFVPDLDAYRAACDTARSLALEAARRATRLDVEVAVNLADDLAHGDLFLTVTGTSAEAGDDGEVGRGNRASGLITPYRAMTLEATAGKNPVTHVGKLYNVAAQRIAQGAAAIPGIRDATCVLVSRIGHPIDAPQIIDVQLATPEIPAAARADVHRLVDQTLSSFDSIRADILASRTNLF